MISSPKSYTSKEALDKSETLVWIPKYKTYTFKFNQQFTYPCFRLSNPYTCGRTMSPKIQLSESQKENTGGWT